MKNETQANERQDRDREARERARLEILALEAGAQGFMELTIVKRSSHASW